MVMGIARHESSDAIRYDMRYKNIFWFHLFGPPLMIAIRSYIVQCCSVVLLVPRLEFIGSITHYMRMEKRLCRMITLMMLALVVWCAVLVFVSFGLSLYRAKAKSKSNGFLYNLKLT